MTLASMRQAGPRILRWTSCSQRQGSPTGFRAELLYRGKNYKSSFARGGVGGATPSRGAHEVNVEGHGGPEIRTPTPRPTSRPKAGCLHFLSKHGKGNEMSSHV